MPIHRVYLNAPLLALLVAGCGGPTEARKSESGNPPRVQSSEAGQVAATEVPRVVPTGLVEPPPATGAVESTARGLAPQGAPAEIAPHGLELDGSALPAATSAYLEGIEALEAARWTEAVAAFSRALESEPDEAVYVRARGVADALAEKFPEAIADLRRVQKLRLGDQEGRIWLAVALQMGGDDYHARETYAEATNDSYETFLGTLRREYSMLNFYLDRVRREGEEEPVQRSKAEASRRAARSMFPRAGAWYARRIKDSSDLTLALFARAKRRLAERDYSGALADVESVRKQTPKDMAVLYCHAACVLGLGDAATARQELTEVLTEFTSFTDAYLKRAVASARLGDARRARADLDTVARIRPEAATHERPIIERELAALRADAPPESPDALLVELRNEAKANAPDDALVKRAVALRKAVTVRRLQADEIYQQRLKGFEDALRADPRNPDRLVEMAEFLSREADRRFERAQPPGPFRILRREVPGDPEGEIARAGRLFDQALAINPRHARAMVGQARILFHSQRFADADALLRQALDIQEDVPDGLELYARVITVGAGQAEEAARGLSEIKTWTSYSVGVTYYYTRYPSAEDLRKAEEFRELARQRMEKARQIFERAIKLRPQDGQGYYDLALWRMRQQDTAGAREALERAVQFDPKLATAHQALARVYRELGMEDRAYQEESTLLNLGETEVEALLQQAWRDMQRTAWKTAETILDRAARQDPSEARIHAFLAVIHTARGKPAEALIANRLALAFEEARARLMGTTFRRGGTGARDVDEFALTITLRLRVGEARVRERRLDEALGLFEDNIALGGRIAVTDMLRDLDSALLPDPAADPDNRPEPENAASLLAWSHFDAGDVLKTLNRRAEAAEHYQAARTAGDGLTVGIGRRPINEPRNRAGLALARLLVEGGDPRAAEEILRTADTLARDSFARELAAEKERIADMIRKAQVGR